MIEKMYKKGVVFSIIILLISTIIISSGCSRVETVSCVESSRSKITFIRGRIANIHAEGISLFLTR
jgi:hypothetical protein